MNTDSTVRTIVRLATQANKVEELARALQAISLGDEPVAAGIAIEALLSASFNPLPDNRVYTGRLFTLSAK